MDNFVPHRKRLLSTLSPKNHLNHNQSAAPEQACCPHYPPKTPTPHFLTSLPAWPAVHTIPQKHLDDKNLDLAGWGPAVHTIPQKPPPTLQSNLPQTACCPHYPPKTGLAHCKRHFPTWPAVHTIPQKPEAGQDATGCPPCLLSTLSPKNQFVNEISNTINNACCPHYPPKTLHPLPTFCHKCNACCPHYPPKTKAFSLQL